MSTAASEEYGLDVEHVETLQQAFDNFLTQLHGETTLPRFIGSGVIVGREEIFGILILTDRCRVCVLY